MTGPVADGRPVSRARVAAALGVGQLVKTVEAQPVVIADLVAGEGDEFQSLIISFGIFIIFQSVTRTIWTADFRRIGGDQNRYESMSFFVGDIAVQVAPLIAFGAAAAIAVGRLELDQLAVFFDDDVHVIRVADDRLGQEAHQFSRVGSALSHGSRLPPRRSRPCK